jgi:pyridoxal phosphate enzyme (YggS family)
MVDVAANYRTIIDRIGDAATKVGRKPEEIKVLAASKSQDVKLIRLAIAAGVQLMGENYVQEAEIKRNAVSESVEWHMIGHLQRNKAKTAVKIFDLIQTLDSAALAVELNKEGKKQERKIRALIEVNLGGEATKSGIAEDKVTELFRVVGDLTYLQVEGLMTVPPFKEDPEDQRPYFSQLRELQMDLERLKVPNATLKELSMGMTHDYPVAVEEGATIVRIGTALFGPRQT